MLPDLESLRCFEAGATHLNFRVASKAVGLSPAAFGDRVKRFEDQLDTPLFIRTTRRVSLTSAGHRLLPHARHVLVQAERCHDIVREISSPAPYEITIGTRFELGLSWLTPALRPLQARCPERTLHLVFGDSGDLLERARKGLVDCVVTSVRLTVGGLSYESLHDEDYVFVGSSTLLRRKPLKHAADAAGHVLLDAAPDLPLFRYFLDVVGRRSIWAFSKVVHLGAIGAVRLRLLQGEGVAVLPRYFVARDLAAKRLVRILPQVKLNNDAFRLIWRKGHPREGELRALAAELAAIPLA